MWHVLHTAPNCEPQVSKFLVAQGLESYAPQFLPPPRTRRGSLRDRRHRWLFPCYIFFRIPDSFRRWDVIRWAPGVRRLLDEDGAAAVIAEEIVDRIRRRLEERSLGLVRTRFVPGQVVVIERGPLAAVDAIFERELDPTSRVEVLINLLGRQLKVEVDPVILRPAG